jgi:uracil phosphoribosyltransferase
MNVTSSKRKLNELLILIWMSGLGMSDAMLELIPSAAVHHIGRHNRFFVVDCSFDSSDSTYCYALFAFAIHARIVPNYL